MTKIMDQLEEVEPSISRLVKHMATRARAAGQYLSVSDARYFTIGNPEIITDTYIFFEDEAYEVGKTGKLGGKPEEYEKINKGGKIIFLSAVISIETSPKP